VGRFPRFRCGYCAGWYDDGPPLITVTGGARLDEEFCSVECAYDAGYSKAVLVRWQSEARDGIRFIFYIRPESMTQLVS
jgi:hypothetical protein